MSNHLTGGPPATPVMRLMSLDRNGRARQSIVFIKLHVMYIMYMCMYMRMYNMYMCMYVHTCACVLTVTVNVFVTISYTLWRFKSLRLCSSANFFRRCSAAA
jgi:hypothetical protein